MPPGHSIIASTYQLPACLPGLSPSAAGQLGCHGVILGLLKEHGRGASRIQNRGCSFPECVHRPPGEAVSAIACVH